MSEPPLDSLDSAVVGLSARPDAAVAPDGTPSERVRDRYLIPLSARTPRALNTAADRLAAWLRERPDAELADVAYTYQVGRARFRHRRFAIIAAAAGAGAGADSLTWPAADRVCAEPPPPVAFVFPDLPLLDLPLPGLMSPVAGKGDGTAAGLCRLEPDFRAVVDSNLDLIGTAAAQAFRAGRLPGEPAQAAGLTCLLWHALARLFTGWGVRPAVIAGEGTGRYVGALLSGKLSEAEALRAVADGRPPREMTGVAPISAAALAGHAIVVLGPATAGARLLAGHPGLAEQAALVATALPDPPGDPTAGILEALGRLWLAGIEPDWAALDGRRSRAPRGRSG